MCYIEYWRRDWLCKTWYRVLAAALVYVCTMQIGGLRSVFSATGSMRTLLMYKTQRVSLLGMQCLASGASAAHFGAHYWIGNSKRDATEDEAAPPPEAQIHDMSVCAVWWFTWTSLNLHPASLTCFSASILVKWDRISICKSFLWEFVWWWIVWSVTRLDLLVKGAWGSWTNAPDGPEKVV